MYIKNKMKPTLSIIIPAYNEEKRIKKTLDDISSFLYFNQIKFEIIVVTNNCTDNTVLLLTNIKDSSIPELIIIDIPKEGIIGNMKGYAIGVGMRHAIGDYHVFVDADNATSFHHILDFIDYIKHGYDVVIGSRYVRGSVIIKKQSILRIIFSRLGNLIIQLLLLPGIWDTQCGFKVFSNDASKIIFSKITINGWGADLEMLAIAKTYNLKIKEAPVKWESQDDSTVSSNAFLNTLKELFIIRKNINVGLYKDGK